MARNPKSGKSSKIWIWRIANSNYFFTFQIQEQLRALKKSTQDCGVEVERTRQLQETHSINFYKHHQISGRLIQYFLCVSRFVSTSTLTLIDRKEQLRARNHSKRGQFYRKKNSGSVWGMKKNFDFFFFFFFLSTNSLVANCYFRNFKALIWQMYMSDAFLNFGAEKFGLPNNWRCSSFLQSNKKIAIMIVVWLTGSFFSDFLHFF